MKLRLIITKIMKQIQSLDDPYCGWKIKLFSIVNHMITFEKLNQMIYSYIQKQLSKH